MPSSHKSQGRFYDRVYAEQSEMPERLFFRNKSGSHLDEKIIKLYNPESIAERAEDDKMDVGATRKSQAI